MCGPLTARLKVVMKAVSRHHHPPEHSMRPRELVSMDDDRFVWPLRSRLPCLPRIRHEGSGEEAREGRCKPADAVAVVLLQGLSDARTWSGR